MSDTELYYDPFNIEINRDPYPVWTQLREDAPLCYTKLDFLVLIQYGDVDKALTNWELYRWGHGLTLEIIQSNFDLPPGITAMEDPPIHDLHRGLVSRMFTQHPERRAEAVARYEDLLEV
jgi:cytochrome P450